MGRVCMGRVGYEPSLSWAEFVMGRDVQLSCSQVTLLTLDSLIWTYCKIKHKQINTYCEKLGNPNNLNP